jgi:hypothetical protein
MTARAAPMFSRACGARAIRPASWPRTSRAGSPISGGVVADWMTSPGHRANILNPQVTQYGFAGAGSVWVLVLARPC